MNTITPAPAAAAFDAARTTILYHAAGTMTAAAAPGIGALVLIVVIILVVSALASAVRSLAALLSELLRVATAVTSVLLTAIIAIFLGIVFLVH